MSVPRPLLSIIVVVVVVVLAGEVHRQILFSPREKRTPATLLAEMAPTARVDCLSAFRNMVGDRLAVQKKRKEGDRERRGSREEQLQDQLQLSAGKGGERGEGEERKGKKRGGVLGG